MLRTSSAISSYTTRVRRITVKYVNNTLLLIDTATFWATYAIITRSQFAVIKKMADVDFTTMLCEPELVMITARTVLFAYVNLGINNIYLTNFMVLMLCLFRYLFKI